jgi:hypothetical protein
LITGSKDRDLSYDLDATGNVFLRLPIIALPPEKSPNWDIPIISLFPHTGYHGPLGIPGPF